MPFTLIFKNNTIYNDFVPSQMYQKMIALRHVTLLGNILLRSIVVSVLIRLINGYSVTDGTWLKIGESDLLVDDPHVVLGIAPPPCDDSPKGHRHTEQTNTETHITHMTHTCRLPTQKHLTIMYSSSYFLNFVFF